MAVADGSTHSLSSASSTCCTYRWPDLVSTTSWYLILCFRQSCRGIHARSRVAETYSERTSLSLVVWPPNENRTLSSGTKFSPWIVTLNSSGLCSFISLMGNGETEVTTAVVGRKGRNTMPSSGSETSCVVIGPSVTSYGSESWNFSSLP